MKCDVNILFGIVFEYFPFSGRSLPVGPCYLLTGTIAPANRKRIAVCLGAAGLGIGHDGSLHPEAAGTVTDLFDRNVPCSVMGSTSREHPEQDSEEEKEGCIFHRNFLHAVRIVVWLPI